jgi:hypothetical protein
LEALKKEQSGSKSDDPHFVTLPAPISEDLLTPDAAEDVLNQGMFPQETERKKYRQPLSARTLRDLSSKEVIAVLEGGANSLDQLANCVGNFVAWWQMTETGLIGLRRVIPQFRLDGSNRLRTSNIRMRWERVRDSYENYVVAVCLLPFVSCVCPSNTHCLD